MNVLIVYASSEGQTKKICSFLAGEIRQQGAEATLIEAGKAKQVSKDYDLVIVAASIHIGSYQKAITKFIKSNLEMLEDQPSSFISVSLTAAGKNAKDLADLENITKTYLQKLNWQPDHILQVAGALRYTKYNFFIKYIMKRIARKNVGATDTSRDYEYTDWQQLKDFVKMILRAYKIKT